MFKLDSSLNSKACGSSPLARQLIRINMKSFLKTFTCLALGFLTAACSTSPTQIADHSFLNEPTGCAILIGGIGSRFAQKDVEQLWQKINASVTNELYARLAEKKYRVVKLIIPFEKADNYESIIMFTAAQNRCSRLLQVTHHVNEDASGKYFRFDIDLFKLQPKEGRSPGAAGTNTVTVGEFAKKYRNPRTMEALDNFYTGTFAETVLGDLEKSGALKPLR